ncbi:hypothetical protein H7I76_36325 [Mycolicibacterium vaccae]|nr:hypothetical protein [Mycolicibacterium vaccae]
MAKIKEIDRGRTGHRHGGHAGVVTAEGSAQPAEPDSQSPAVAPGSAWWVLIAGVLGLLASAR